MEKGFYFQQGKKEIFIVTNAQRKTDNIARLIIDVIAANNSNIAPEIVERAKQDAATLKDVKRRTDAATLEEKTTPSGSRFYTISGKNFSFNYPQQDFFNEVIIAKTA